MQSDRSEQKTEVSPFDMICDAALANDPDLLSNALQFVCIDVWRESEYGTPVTRLAYLGKVDAVKFLLDRGASPANAACGYARAGNMEELYNLIDHVKEKNPDKLTAVLKRAAYGIALSQDEEKIKAFLEKIEKDDPTQIPELQSDLFMGHAQANNLTKAMPYPHDVNTRLAIVQGMGLSGNLVGIEQFIKNNLYSYLNNKNLFNNGILTCLARGGHSDKSPSLSFYNQARERSRLLIEGNAQNGIDYPPIDIFAGNAIRAWAFAFGGHKAKAYEYGKPEEYDDNNGNYGTRYSAFLNIGIGFIKGNHLDAAYDFFKNNMSHQYINSILNGIAKAFYDNRNLKDATAFLEKMQDDPKVDRKHVRLFGAGLKNNFLENQEDIDFCLREKEKASLLRTHLTGPLPLDLVNLIIQYSKEMPLTDTPTLQKNKAAFFPEPPSEIPEIPTVHIKEQELKQESKITPSGITQQNLRDILDGYKPANIFGTPSKEIAALSRLADDPRFKGVLIHHSVIASILSPYPERHALFTRADSIASDKDTDRIILKIRALYQEKGLWEEYSDPKPGRKNRKR